MNNKPINTLVWVGAGRLRSDYLSDAEVGRLEGLGSPRFIVTSGRMFTAQDMIHESQGFQATITTWGTPNYTDEVLAGCPELKFYGRIGGSVRNLVGESAWARGIAVVTAVDMQGQGMAEITLTLMLAGLHRLTHHARRQAGAEIIAHDGGNKGIKHGMLLERTVGLIGFGTIARHVARLLTPFRCRVSAFDPYVSDETLAQFRVSRAQSVEALCETSDVVSVHAARLPETRHILSADAVKRMQPNTLIVNTAFQDLMDLSAIEARVMAGDLCVAMDNLDVLDAANAHKIAVIRKSENCIITPATFPNTDGVALMGRQVVEELERFSRGEPLQHAVEHRSLATRA